MVRTFQKQQPPATLPEYSVYKDLLMKLSSPTNLQEVEIITPWSTSGSLGVCKKERKFLPYLDPY